MPGDLTPSRFTQQFTYPVPATPVDFATHKTQTDGTQTTQIIDNTGNVIESTSNQRRLQELQLLTAMIADKNAIENSEVSRMVDFGAFFRGTELR